MSKEFRGWVKTNLIEKNLDSVLLFKSDRFFFLILSSLFSFKIPFPFTAYFFPFHFGKRALVNKKLKCSNYPTFPFDSLSWAFLKNYYDKGNLIIIIIIIQR